MKLFFSPLIIICFSYQAQFLNTNNFLDTSLVDREELPSSYSFGMPINSDILLSPPTFPSMDKRFYMSLFGPRYKTTSGTNETTYDFHQGEDITGDFTINGQSFTSDPNVVIADSSNLARLLCMCDGIVDELIEGTNEALENTETGRSIRIKCNKEFSSSTHQTAWGNIYIAYRHTSKIMQNLSLGQTVTIGDTLAWIGSSGLTSLIHLHLSVQYKNASNSFVNVHPMRIFDPTLYPHVHRTLESVSIEKLAENNDSVLYRISVPREQVALKQIKVSGENNYYEVFDFEEISKNPNRDNPFLLPNIHVLTYSFNRAQNLVARYEATANTMPDFYPASPNRTVLQGVYPIENVFPYNDENGRCAFDLIVKGFPNNFNKESLQVCVSDIYGNTLQSEKSSGLSETQSTEIKLFPNPTKDGVFLILPNESTLEEITVLDATGKKIQVNRIEKEGEKTKIYFKELKKGNYFVRVHFISGENKEMKFIME